MYQIENISKEGEAIFTKIDFSNKVTKTQKKNATHFRCFVSLRLRGNRFRSEAAKIIPIVIIQELRCFNKKSPCCTPSPITGMVKELPIKYKK